MPRLTQPRMSVEHEQIERVLATFRELVRQWMRDHPDVKQPKLARRAGVSQTYISRLLDGRGGARTAIGPFLRLAAAIDVDLTELLATPWRRSPDEPEIAVLIERVRRLYQQRGTRVLDLVANTLRGLSAEPRDVSLAADRAPTYRRLAKSAKNEKG